MPDRIPAAVLRAFADLTEAFELGAGTVESRPRGGWVSFQGRRSRLVVEWEVGSPPWVRLGTAEGPWFGLHELVDLRAPERAASLPLRDTPVDLVLEALAGLTGELGADLLVGDGSAMRELLQRRAIRRRKAHQAEWGTATGESPRFSSRPTLSELFSDAANDGMITARVYQAVWDWDYGSDQVAAHLGESEARVRARLDDWDGIG